MKCIVCGKGFELLQENKKIVKSPNGVLGREIFYEAFYCPYCGCQNVVNEYKSEVGGKQ
jgi:hypothetical protein